MNIVLFGFKKSGKSHYGSQLATRLGRAFMDTDRLLELLFASEKGRELSCREIFLEYGPEAFRAMEYDVIMSLQDVQNSVIAVGGGAVLDSSISETLQKMGQLVYLDVEKKELKKRMLTGDQPAYLDTDNPEAAFEQMYDERLRHYEELPAYRLVTAGKSDAAILDELAGLIDGG